MPWPNFSESQVQQVCNIEIFKMLGGYNYPIIPNLVEEGYLGWDTGFIINKGKTPAPDQKGCNLFIQYKLAYHVQSGNGAQYNSWRKPYYRFQIPHNHSDYHQYNLLRNLCQRGYPVLYIANSVSTIDALANARYSLDSFTAAVSLANIPNYHKYVTYTQHSSHVKLHSETSDAERYFLTTSLKNDIMLNEKWTTLEQDINGLSLIFFEEDQPIINQLRDWDIATYLKWLYLVTQVNIHTGIRIIKWFPEG